MLINKLSKSAAVIGAIGAFGLGGAAIADATNDSPTASTAATAAGPTGTPPTGTPPTGAPPTGAPPTGAGREALTGDVAAKVKAAALERVPGATVLETHAGGPYDTAYHAHVERADGTPRVVPVSAAFEASAPVAGSRPGGRGGPGGPGGPCPGPGDDPTA